MKKEDSKYDPRIEEIIESLDGIKQAEPGPFLFSRIKATLEQSGPAINYRFISFRQASLAIAALLILLLINFTVLKKYKSIERRFQANESSSSESVLIGQFQLY